MRKGLFLALVAGVLVPLLVLSSTEARAAAPTTSVPLLAGTYCTGSLKDSGNPSVLPDGDFVSVGAFLGPVKGDVAPTGNKSKSAGPVVWLFLIVDDGNGGACADLSYNATGSASSSPCHQGVFATGNYSIISTSKGVPASGLLNVDFSDAPSPGKGQPGQPPGSDPFDGCSATLNVYDYHEQAGKFEASTMTLAGRLTSTPGSSSTCNFKSSGLTMGCYNIHN
jgi:hypothetical protein